MKTSKYVDELSLYDVVNTPGVAADLSHISTPAVRSHEIRTKERPLKRAQSTDNMLKKKITGYLPKDDGMKNAFTGADIVVIPAGIPRTS